MRQRNRANASSLFLMELILAILFFSLACSVCVPLFVKSHLLSNESRTLNYASNQCSNAAELLSASSSLEQFGSLLSEQYPDLEQTGTGWTVFYDDRFGACTRQDAAWCMALSCTEESGMLTADITVSGLSGNQSGQEVYTLFVKHHPVREVLP